MATSPLEAMVLLGTLQVSWLEAREVGGSLARQDRLLEGARELLSTRPAPLIMLDTVAMLTSGISGRLHKWQLPAKQRL